VFNEKSPFPNSTNLEDQRNEVLRGALALPVRHLFQVLLQITSINDQKGLLDRFQNQWKWTILQSSIGKETMGIIGGSWSAGMGRF